MVDVRDSQSVDEHDHGSAGGESQCRKCKGTGKYRDKYLLLIAGTALLFAIIAPPFVDIKDIDSIEGSPIVQVLALLGGVASLICVWTLYRFLRGVCGECNGTGKRSESKPAVPFLWRQDREKLQPGKCRQCGYDLTGNVSGRCPECGTPCLDV